MSFFALDGHRVWYTAVGEGEPLILLHNGGNDHRIWQHQVAYFSRTRRVYMLDHLGYGQSDKPDLEYDLALYVREVEAFLVHERLGPTTLIGHCIGAGMALGLALRQPERVRALVLFNIATEKTARAGALRPLIGLLEERPGLQRALSALTRRTGSPRWLTERLLRLQLGPACSPPPAFLEHAHELYNRENQFRALYSLCVHPRRWAELDAVTRPASFPPLLLFWGARNRVLPASAGRELAERLRPDALEILEGSGHLPMLERPDIVNTRIEAFLSDGGSCSVGTGTQIPRIQPAIEK